jgi:septal ring factor EnvC (AmiA/AmiB activator)
MADSSASEDEKPYRTVQQQQNHDKALAQANRETSQTRSRSASRRARRQRIKQGIDSGKYMKTASLEALEEADAAGELDQMQMFERIGPDSTSMEGPVTHARAMRGEIPARGGEVNAPYKQEKLGSLDKQDGLKLKIEANLDVEIELKASIRGDLTLCLL